MTSFEPENLGNLIDNMEFRRLNLDQLKQLQFQQLIQQQSQTLQLAASAAAQAAAIAATSGLAGSGAGSSGQPPSTPTKTGASSAAAAAVVQQAALAAAQAALANLQLAGPSSALLAANSSNSQPALRRQYSIMLNPSVYLLGDEAASIAYTKLSQLVDMRTGLLTRMERSEETRIWHRKPPGSGQGCDQPAGAAANNNNKWFCVHLHKSLSSATSQLAADWNPPERAQTGDVLLRALANQQQLSNWAAVQQQHQLATIQGNLLAPGAGPVPLISLNHSSAGNSQQSSQHNQSTSSASASAASNNSSAASR